MTKEELEKESNFYAENVIPADMNYYLTKRYSKEQLKRAYLAGAEPREKRIDELEKANEMQALRIKECNELLLELKAQIEKMKCCGNCTKGNCVNIGQKGKACAYWTSNELKEIKEND